MWFLCYGVRVALVGLCVSGGMLPGWFCREPFLTLQKTSDQNPLLQFFSLHSKLNVQEELCNKQTFDIVVLKRSLYWTVSAGLGAPPQRCWADTGLDWRVQFKAEERGIKPEPNQVMFHKNKAVSFEVDLKWQCAWNSALRNAVMNCVI